MKTLEELQELAVQMNYTLEELMYEMLCDSVDDLELKDKEIDKLTNIEYKCEFLDWYNDDLQQENERLKDLYRRTIEHLFKIGNDELARYFQAQINDCPSFVPQDIRGDE